MKTCKNVNKLLYNCCSVLLIVKQVTKLQSSGQRKIFIVYLLDNLNICFTSVYFFLMKKIGKLLFFFTQRLVLCNSMNNTVFSIRSYCSSIHSWPFIDCILYQFALFLATTIGLFLYVPKINFLSGDPFPVRTLIYEKTI